ncbi:MAG: ABC transporter substrate-binding protein [Actinobacteria bacterium]|nr:ABC transporter substrate-binding protein [Actinomycetota bacterium]MCA1719676.1 ABC transporter substrate-binding protein [Actinomycetota bacterium]
MSLLPSATEMAYALGLGAQVVGVTHECTWPPEVATLPRVSWSSIPPAATSAEIEQRVVAAAAGGPPTTGLHDDLLRALAPDVVLTQDLCAVCAVPAGDVDAAMSRLGCAAQVVSLDPSTLGEVLGGIEAVALAAGRPEAAAPVVAGLRARLAAVRAAVADRPRPRVFALEWADPPFNAGHWLPEMIEIAGGTPVLAEAGGRSVRVTWDDIAAAAPDVLVFVPCGHDLATAVREGAELVLPQTGVSTVVAAHGDAYFSRPGPRLVEGVELLAGLLHPQAWPAPGPDAAVVLRAPTGASGRP